MKLTDRVGCVFNDRIDLELSPRDVEGLIDIYQEKALKANSYGEQGLYRTKKDYFQSRYDLWKKEREKKDKP